MVLNYDRNPKLTIDEKLDSLAQSMQLALNEIENRLNDMQKEMERMQKEIDSMGA